jgi:hypothetical protein
LESSLDSPISSDDVLSQQPAERRLKYTSNPSHSQLPLKYTGASGTETAVIRRPFLHPSETQRRLSLYSQTSFIHDVHPPTYRVPAGATCTGSLGRATCGTGKAPAVAPLELRVASHLAAVSAVVAVAVSKAELARYVSHQCRAFSQYSPPSHRLRTASVGVRTWLCPYVSVGVRTWLCPDQ